MSKRYKLFIAALAGLILLLSGIPYVGYLTVRNKVLAHHKWTHVTPDDVIHVWAMGMIGKLPGGLNRAMYLANPGGTIYIPAGSFPQNSAFAPKSSLTLIGAGSGDPNAQGCPTTITSTLSSGDLFPIADMNHVKMAHFCIVQSGTGANAAFNLNYGQYVTLEDIYVYGPFAAVVILYTSATSNGSTIRNNFYDIHASGLAAGSTCFKLDSSDATTKTINGNNFFNVGCTAGTGGKAFWLTNTNQAQIINENIINCAQCTASGGTAIQIDQGATSDTVILASNLEGSTVGVSKANNNTVTWIGGGSQSNGTNVSDSQPAYTAFLGTRIGGVLANFGVTPIGGGYFDSIGVGGGRPSSIAIDGFVGINGASGYCLSVSAVCKWQVQTGALVPNTAGGSDAGSASNPIGSVYIGNAATNNFRITGTATAARTVTLPDASFTVSQTIAGGTAVLGTGNINSNVCAAAVTVAATGTLTTDAIAWSFNADPNAVTGYGAGATGTLSIWAYPTANNVNFRVCNLTAGAINAGAATLNWRVTR